MCDECKKDNASSCYHAQQPTKPETATNTGWPRAEPIPFDDSDFANIPDGKPQPEATEPKAFHQSKPGPCSTSVAHNPVMSGLCEHNFEEFHSNPHAANCTPEDREDMHMSCTEYAPTYPVDPQSHDKLDELDTVLNKLHHNGYYDEAKRRLSEDVREFVEYASWAGELHAQEIHKLAKEDLLTWHHRESAKEREAEVLLLRAALIRGENWSTYTLDRLAAIKPQDPANQGDKHENSNCIPHQSQGPQR